MFLCPEVNRTKMFPRETFWCDPGDSTRILQDEGLGLLQTFKKGSYTKETFLRFCGPRIKWLGALACSGVDIPRGGMEPSTFVVSLLAVQFVDGRQKFLAQLSCLRIKLA